MIPAQTAEPIEMSFGEERGKLMWDQETTRGVQICATCRIRLNDPYGGGDAVHYCRSVMGKSQIKIIFNSNLKSFKKWI